MRLELIGDVFECLDGFTTAQLIGTSAYVHHEIKRIWMNGVAEDTRFKEDLIAAIPEHRQSLDLWVPFGEVPFSDGVKGAITSYVGYLYAINVGDEVALGRITTGHCTQFSRRLFYFIARASSVASVCAKYNRLADDSDVFIPRLFVQSIARYWNYLPVIRLQQELDPDDEDDMRVLRSRYDPDDYY